MGGEETPSPSALMTVSEHMDGVKECHYFTAIYSHTVPLSTHCDPLALPFTIVSPLSSSLVIPAMCSNCCAQGSTSPPVGQTTLRK